MSLSEETIVLSGLKPEDYKKVIEDQKGRITTAISGKTTLLVIKDKSDNSAKVKKAKELGIKILTKDEFAEKYLDLKTKKTPSPPKKLDKSKQITIHVKFDANTTLTKNKSVYDLLYKQYSLWVDEWPKLLPNNNWIMKERGVFVGPADEETLFKRHVDSFEISLVPKRREDYR